MRTLADSLDAGVDVDDASTWAELTAAMNVLKSRADKVVRDAA